jgi:charged multivesicular body protein 6
MRLEDVEKLMGDTEDAIEYQQEIERTLVGDGAIDLDNDEELMRELQAIETMEADGAALALPSVPTNDVIAASPLSLSKVKSDENKMVSNSKTAQALLAT